MGTHFLDFPGISGFSGFPRFHSFLRKTGKRPISPVVTLFEEKVKPRFQAFYAFFRKWVPIRQIAQDRQ